MNLTRQTLPQPCDRLPLGISGLKVSPFCLGLVPLPEIVPTAFDMGINFFFLTADLHWPLYEGLRKGLELLLARSPSVRDEIVVGVVSYLDQPMFQHMQFNEVIDSVKGLGRVDLLVAGAIPNVKSFNARFPHIQSGRGHGLWGSRAIGASFHDRPTALSSINLDCVDAHFIRYNTGHPGARNDIFPFVRQDRAGLIYNFTTMLGRVYPERFRELGLSSREWLPKPTDYYRFVLTNSLVNGLLCAPRTLMELEELSLAMKERPLSPQEEAYMIWLSSIANPKYF